MRLYYLSWHGRVPQLQSIPKFEVTLLTPPAMLCCVLCADAVPANHPAAISTSRNMFGRLAALVGPKSADSTNDPDRATGDKARPDNSITAVLSDLVHIWAKNTTAPAAPQATVQAVEAPKTEAAKAL